MLKNIIVEARHVCLGMKLSCSDCPIVHVIKEHVVPDVCVLVYDRGKVVFSYCGEHWYSILPENAQQFINDYDYGKCVVVPVTFDLYIPDVCLRRC